MDVALCSTSRALRIWGSVAARSKGLEAPTALIARPSRLMPASTPRLAPIHDTEAWGTPSSGTKAAMDAKLLSPESVVKSMLRVA